MNKVVLITGASRGIGKSTAEVFASHGFNVVINYLNSEKEALVLSKELESKYKVKTLPIKCDVSNEEEVKNMFKKITENFSNLDVVVNNAAIAIDTIFEDKTKENFRKIIDTNLIGTFLICKEAKKYMNSGSIINISSTNADYSYYPFSMDYDASKAGINLLTKNLAIEFAPNIRVNAVAPGWTLTEFIKNNLDSDYRKEEEKQIVLGRFAEPVEIANVIYFLSSKEASYINGTIITVDGGKK